MTELLRKGAQDLIGQAVESELAELLAQYRTVARVMEKRPLCVMVINRNASCNRHWSRDGTDPEGSFEERRCGNFSFGVSATVCSQDREPGSRRLAVLEGDIDW